MFVYLEEKEKKRKGEFDGKREKEKKRKGEYCFSSLQTYLFSIDLKSKSNKKT